MASKLRLAALVIGLTCLGGVSAADTTQEKPTQSILLRAVSITYDLERSLVFYRDILGQDVLEDVPLSAERAASWLEVSPQAKIRFVVLRGKGEYPGGPIAGGRIAFIAIDDPEHPPGSVKKINRRGVHGDVILPHRVANLDGIVRRLKAEKFEFLFEPRVSPTGLSRNCMVFDPNGHIVELFELK
jgi:catechol 2,3-dioxygenase-like lactoylglutathione lyase family enzyme